MATLSARNFALLVQRPIAACVASAFMIAGSPSALAGTVTSCVDDFTSGTLRSVIAAAAEGETINFSAALNCSKISLMAGELQVLKNSLTIDGAVVINGVASRVTLDAHYLPRPLGVGRVFTHLGTGTLTLKNLTATRGGVGKDSIGKLASPYGGCIGSKGSVTLEQVEVSHCEVYSPLSDGSLPKYTNAMPVGGAIAAANDVTLTNSSVTYSSVGGYGAKGGGIYSGRNVTLTNSLVGSNTATCGEGVDCKVYGGGIFAKGNLTITASGVSYNTAIGPNEAAGGGAYVGGDLNADAGGNFSSMSGNSVSSINKPAQGGAAFVHGNFSSTGHSYIKYNSVASNLAEASGGGLYVGGILSLSSGMVSGNTAGSTGGFTRGGGARALGGMVLQYATISNNAANDVGVGGGLVAADTTVIRHSTISNNSAGGAYGGLLAMSQTPATPTLTLENTTLSGNTAGYWVGGLYTNFGHVKLQDSTIAFNSAPSPVLAAGVHLSGTSTALLQNTLISNNSNGTADEDLTAGPNVTFSAASSTNLIRATALKNQLAGSTTFDVCPQLGPLRSNGGPTQTHALQSHSPAIDHGGPTNFIGQTGYDQRGSSAHNGSTGNYPRISGPVGAPNPVADIGAHEVQQGDVVFDTSFEGCNP
jgi:hypothetical protein